MLRISRIVLPVLAILAFTLPAAAVQPVGSAAWINHDGVAYTGYGPGYSSFEVEGGTRVRVDRCHKLWCQFHTGHTHGWIFIENLNFGREPGGLFSHLHHL